MGVLGERERDLAAKRGDLARLVAALSETDGKITQAVARLNERMTVLGERDHDVARTGAALATVEDRLAGQQTRYEATTGRLNHRLQLLGEIERQTAESDRHLQNLVGQVARGTDQLAAIQSDMIDKQTALAQVQVEQAQAERSGRREIKDLAETEQRLKGTQGQLAEVEGQLEHAVLASDVIKLTGQRAELSQQVAALEQEIKRKGPLADSAVALSTRVAGLQDQIVDLTRDRDQAASKLQRTQADLDMAEADRKLAVADYDKLVQKVSGLRGQKADLEIRLTDLGAEVKHQDSVFATLEVLKKEQDFLRGLVGGMLDEGKEARQQIDDLRVESASLVAQRLEIQKELASKQAQSETLDKAIMAKDEKLDGQPGVRNARSF